MVRAIAESPILKIVVLTIFTLLATVFLRLLSNPARNPFRLRTYSAIDVDIGVELSIVAWVSYLVGMAERLNLATETKSSPSLPQDKVIAVILISALLAIIAVLTPVYVRLCSWRPLPRRRYEPTRRTVWVPNVIGFLTLIATAYLVQEVR